MGTPRSVIFAGCAQDCARFLPRVLKNIQRVSALFAQSAFVVCENDSADATKKMLSEWGAGRENFELVNLDGLGNGPSRSARLAFVRNVVIEFIKTWEKARGFELLFLMDFDDVNVDELDLETLSKALEWMSGQRDVAAIFPNQIGGPYYDLWALRHETRCPTDIWEELLDYSLKNKCDKETAFQATLAKRIFALPQDAEPLEVHSAFGGFGIYRLDYVLKNKNPYLGQKIKVLRDAEKYSVVLRDECEHIHFHEGIRDLGGKLFVMPGLVNGNTKDFSFSWSGVKNRVS